MHIDPPLSREDAHRPRVLQILLLVAFTLAFRALTPMVLHTGIDARDYWNSARAIARGTEYPDITHRTIRWPVILPEALIQVVAGDTLWAAYAIPMLFQIFQTILLYLLGTRMGGRATGTLAALMMVLFPFSIRTANQIMPESFSVTFLLAAFWILLDWMDDPDRKPWRLTLLAGAVFIAYLTKITNLYFLPGMVVVIFLESRSWKQTLMFCGILFGLYCLETLAYFLFTPWHLGQLQIILTNHIKEAEVPYPYTGVTGLLMRYAPAHLQAYWQVPMAVAAVAGIVMVLKRASREWRALALVGLSFFLAITFGFRSLDPLKLFERFLNRYFMAVMGFVFLADAWLLVQGSRFLQSRWKRLSGIPLRPLTVIAGVLILAAVPAAFTVPRIRNAASLFAWNPADLSTHAWIRNSAYADLMVRTLDAGEPVVAANTPAGRNALETACTYYLPERFRTLPVTTFTVGDLELAALVPGIPAPDSPGSGEFTNVTRNPFKAVRTDAAGLAKAVHDAPGDGEDE